MFLMILLCILGGVFSFNIINSIFFILASFCFSAFGKITKWSWLEYWSDEILQWGYKYCKLNCIFPVGNRWCIDLSMCIFLVSVILFNEEEYCDQHISLRVSVLHWYLLHINPLLHQRGYAFVYCGQVYDVYIYYRCIRLGKWRQCEYF